MLCIYKNFGNPSFSTARVQALFIPFNERYVTTGEILIHFTHGPLTQPNVRPRVLQLRAHPPEQKRRNNHAK